MDSQTFNLLDNFLPLDCLLIVNDYYRDLVRNDFNIVFKSLYPCEQEYWISRNFYQGCVTYYSRLIMRFPYYTAKLALVRSYIAYDDPRSQLHMYQNIDKYLYVNNYQNRIFTNIISAINKKNNYQELQYKEKGHLLVECFDNGVEAYKSWTKGRIIRALLKA